MKDTFKYHLGAAVVLATSAPILGRQIKEDAYNDALDRFARAATDMGASPATLASGIVSAREIVEHGVVIGRAEYAESPDSFLVRYRDGAGCQREEWFSERAIDWLDVPKGEDAAEDAAAYTDGATVDDLKPRDAVHGESFQGTMSSIATSVTNEGKLSKSAQQVERIYVDRTLTRGGDTHTISISIPVE